MSNLLNQVYKIKAECLTPLVIQSGREIMPWEYVIFEENGKKILYRFNVFEFYEKLSPEEKEEFKKKLETLNILEVRKWISDRYTEGKKDKNEIKRIAQYFEEADGNFCTKYNANIGKTEQNDESNQLAIREFTRSRGRAFVPGSSIKGAVRTALLLGEGKTGDRNYVYEIEGMKRKKNVEKDEFIDFLVTDSNSIKDDKIRVGWFERAAPQSIEHLIKDATFKFEIRINEVRRKLSKARRKEEENKIDFSKENIAESANDFTKYKIKEYIADSEKLLKHPDMSNKEQEKKKEKTENLIEFYRNFLENIIGNLKNNEFVINIGFGGSFWFKSFFEEHPKTGNKIETFIDDNIEISRSLWSIDHRPLGFIRCEII